MKILRLAAENFKRLVAVEIKPDGNAVVITGKNGAGKSAVLDAIVAALGGKKSLPRKPIRDGEESAVVELETDAFTVTRTFTGNNSYLRIVNADDAEVKSPQAMLDEIVGAIAFDPMEFARQDARIQRQTLMELVGLDFSDLDGQIASLKAARSQAKTDKSNCEHRAANYTATAGLPAKEISMGSVTAELNEALAQSDKCKACHNSTLRLEESRETIKSSIETMQEQLEDVEVQIKKLGPPPKPIDIGPIQEKLCTLEDKNRLIRDNTAHREAKKQATAAAKTFADLGRQVKAVEAEKGKRLADVKMPVKGLSVAADCVMHDGIPLEQVNSAKQLEVGVAISMAMNPTLRVLRMDGNGLDADSLKVISNMVKAGDYQAWIERVEGVAGAETGILIKDGMVKETWGGDDDTE